jgi:UPF0716 family protein affecting phage T7 exclusion
VDLYVLAIIGGITCIVGVFFFISIIWDLVRRIIDKRVSLKQELNDLRWELFHAKNEIERLKEEYEPDSTALEERTL